MKVATSAKALNEYKINNEKIVHRYTMLIQALHEFVDRYNLRDRVLVNGRILEQLVVDYFVDNVRIKEFHNIKITNTEKVYAYSAYWLNRRKPLQAKNNFKGCEFINECFVATYLMSNIAAERGLDSVAIDKNPMYKQFQDLLFYNLKYRVTSQQSLELMIEAFFCGCDFSTL